MYAVNGKMHFGKAGRSIQAQSISNRNSHNNSNHDQRQLEKKLEKEKKESLKESLEDSTMENIILQLNVLINNLEFIESASLKELNNNIKSKNIMIDIHPAPEEKHNISSFEDVFNLISNIKNVDTQNNKLHKVLAYTFELFFSNNRMDLILKLFDITITQKYIKTSYIMVDILSGLKAGDSREINPRVVPASMPRYCASSTGQNGVPRR